MSLRRVARTCILPFSAVIATSCNITNHNKMENKMLSWSMNLTQSSTMKMKSLHTYPANDPSEDRCIYYENKDNFIRIFGVFDGHGGWNVSHYLHNNMTEVLLRNIESLKSEGGDFTVAETIERAMFSSFSELEEGYINKIRSAYELGFGEVARVGSCALVGVIKGDDLVIANAGDCLAVLGQVSSVKKDAKKSIIAHQINREHNARNSLEQLLLDKNHPNEDDIVKCKSPHACYVKGKLQLTRAFGDLYLKSHEFNAPPGEHRSRGRHIPPPYTPPYVNYMPDVYKIKLNKEKDKFVILATDGLWDFMEPQEAVDIVARVCNSCSPDEAAKYLVEEALLRASEEAHLSVSELKDLPPGRRRRTKHDDTTVVVVYV